MAQAPQWKLFREGNYVGALKDIYDATLAVQGCIADEIRSGHSRKNRVWPIYGEPGRVAAPLDLFDSYDAAVAAMLSTEEQAA